MSEHRKSGFTLIELLVVISVIALLISILLPALGTARITANATQSTSNIRGLQLSIFNYASDSKSASPYVTFPTTANTSPYFYNGKYVGAAYNWASVLWDMSYIEDFHAFWSTSRDLNTTYNFGWAPLNQRFGKVSGVASMIDRTPGAYSGQAGNYWTMIGYGMIPQYTNLGVAASNYANIRNVDTAGRMKLDSVISLVESWSSTGQTSGTPASGFTYMKPGCMPGFSASFSQTTLRLYNYNNNVVRSYWDGHAVVGESGSIGWDCTAINNTYIGSPYGGAWTYNSTTQWNNRKPWYTDWENTGVLN